MPSRVNPCILSENIPYKYIQFNPDLFGLGFKRKNYTRNKGIDKRDFLTQTNKKLSKNNFGMLLQSSLYFK